MNTSARIINALKEGWGFQQLKMAESETQRHSIWIQKPEESGWRAHKVDGNIKGANEILHALINDAGVPKE